MALSEWTKRALLESAVRGGAAAFGGLGTGVFLNDIFAGSIAMISMFGLAFCVTYATALHARRPTQPKGET